MRLTGTNIEEAYGFARDRYAELAKLWADADADLPALAEVKTGAK